MRRLALLLVVVVSCLLSSACRESPRLRASRGASEESPPAPATDRPVLEGPRVRFEHAPEGEVRALVRAFVARVRAEGREPIVYVGATWCEPCRYFHAAAERGDLDASLPPLALLEFDRDRDGDRLDAAGYGSRMIPLFVSPEPDGAPSARRIEGSIHGPDSPQEIVPRLLAVLASTRELLPSTRETR